LKVLDEFRRLIAAVQSLDRSLHALTQTMDEAGPATERLDALELSRVRFEADIEGLLLKAEGKWKASAASETRARNMLKHYESEADLFDSDSDEESEAVPDGYAPDREEEEVLAVPVGVEETYKTRALRRKFNY